MMQKMWKRYTEGSKVDPSGGKILFARHGESQAYKNIAATHSKEVHLTPYGKKQGEELGERFICPPDLIVISDYARAWETAQPTLERFPDTPWQFSDIHEFTYLGSLDGFSCTMQERKSLVKDYWKRCDPLYRDGNGESFEMFIKRVGRNLDEIWQESGSILFFTHEQYIIAAQGLIEGWISSNPTKAEMQYFRNTLLEKQLSHPYGQIVELPEHFDKRNTAQHSQLRKLVYA